MHGDADAASSKKNTKVKVDERYSFYKKSIAQRQTILLLDLQQIFFFFLVLIFINCYFGFNVAKPIISGIEPNSPAFNAGLKRRRCYTGSQ